jgi:glyoxylase-like metal-dependent hydrolase (beta-lactamase superfamily II)
MNPAIQSFFDEATFTVTYLVSDPGTRRAVVIDPVLDFDPKAGRTSTMSADKILTAAREANLSISWILETHAHADHLSAAVYLKEQTGAKVAIGEHIKEVQKVFKPVFHAVDLTPDGTQFDRLLADGDVLNVGGMAIRTLFTPGHTPACVSYQIGNNVFVGDTLFMPDYGTARADFPGGDAHALYRSIRRILSLPQQTALWMCHDYKPAGRAVHMWQSTVAEERAYNIHIQDGVGEDEFVARRMARDHTLSMPQLILPSVQVNIRAGHMPPADSDGHVYLKLPVNRF